MKDIKEQIRKFDHEITFESLKEFIKQIPFNEISYQDIIVPPETEGDYGRNIITLDPFECVVINWPASVESAVHHHKGLFGYVYILEGELDNHFYDLSNNQLIERSIDRYGAGGLIPEPDGVIHKLRNNADKRAVSIHFYYPSIVSFKGMKIYNLATSDIGSLSDTAKTASWIEKDGHFDHINRKAFEFISFEDLNAKKSHFISNIIPKPQKERINAMNNAYFNEQAAKYDFSDFNQPNRKKYIETIDRLIAEDLAKDNSTKKLLDIATGTGRRALQIKALSRMDYEIVGVDISSEMCEIASSRGIRTYHQDWANDDEHIGEYFDAATFLYAFGHIADRSSRLKALRKICDYLNPNGVLYLDLFCINNKNEWGPLALDAYNKKLLVDYGYEKGDVFYRKRGCKEIAFLHYFSKAEIKEILNECGFEMEWIKKVGYSRNPGEIVNTENEGNLFIKARKR